MEKYKVQTATIIRTVCLVLTFVNQMFAIFGIKTIAITDEQVNLFISTGVTIGVSVWTWWKNNSFTQHALKADDYGKSIK